MPYFFFFFVYGKSFMSTWPYYAIHWNSSPCLFSLCMIKVSVYANFLLWSSKGEHSSKKNWQITSFQMGLLLNKESVPSGSNYLFLSCPFTPREPILWQRGQYLIKSRISSLVIFSYVLKITTAPADKYIFCWSNIF